MNALETPSIHTMNTFEQLCQCRRSVRKYTDRPIEQTKLDYILRCALMAPSSHRSMPWEFYVLTRPEQLRPLAACRTYGSGMFATATSAIVVALDSAATDTWQADGAIAAQNILLAAAEQGIGACWCHVYQREGAEQLVRSLAGVSENLNVLCVIALGYPDEEKQPFDITRLHYEKVIRVGD